MPTSLWREELYHPLLVHLPIGLLLTATGMRIAAVVLRRKLGAGFLLPASRLLLLIGVAGAWVAVYTGGLAEDVVNRVICDPTVTHLHEDFAYWTGYAFSLALVLEILAWRFADYRRYLVGISLVSLLTGASLLLRTGQLGAELVYLQGAGVYHPSTDCREFE